MKTITSEELKKWMDDGREFPLINVLPRESFIAEHIPNSQNIPVQDSNFVDQVLDAVERKDKMVVVHCASFECDASEKAAMKLEVEGFTNVYVFKGGIKDWREHDYSLKGTPEAMSA